MCEVVLWRFRNCLQTHYFHGNNIFISNFGVMDTFWSCATDMVWKRWEKCVLCVWNRWWNVFLHGFWVVWMWDRGEFWGPNVAAMMSLLMTTPPPQWRQLIGHSPLSHPRHSPPCARDKMCWITVRNWRHWPYSINDSSSSKNVG